MVPGTGGDILEDGFLVQWKGTNPATGEAWKPVWVSRDKCPAEMVAKWESSKVGDAGRGTVEGMVQAPKRPASPDTPSTSDLSIGRELESCKKKPKLEKRIGPAKGRPTYTGFRPFNPKPKPIQRKVTADKPVDSPPKETVTVQDSESSAHWLLDSVMCTKRGMTVVISGSSGGHDDRGWYNGEYEGEHGVVKSVFNTGNGSFSSTAQVKILNPREGAPSVFAIPVEYLVPVGPENPGQKALVLDGDCKGEVAVIREEGEVVDEWFVSVRNNHFEISGEKLVLYSEVTDTF